MLLKGGRESKGFKPAAAINKLRVVFHRLLTVSVTSPSSGLGSASRSAMLANSVLMVRLGFHAPFGGGFRMSRQIRPSASMLGWYTGVTNRTLGGSIGYLVCLRRKNVVKWRKSNEGTAERNQKFKYAPGWDIHDQFKDS